MNRITKVSPLLKEAELHKQPIIIVVNKFDEKSAADFRRAMSAAHNTGQEIIPIIIDSYGGQVYSLMSMIAAIKAAELPVATIVEGKAMSCGAILFTFGEEGMRFMDRDATIMIHDVSSMNFGKIEELKASVAETDRLNDKVYKMMAQNCGKRADYFMKLIAKKKHADWFIDSEEAKKHNLANHIRLPSLKINVDVNIDFE